MKTQHPSPLVKVVFCSANWDEIDVVCRERNKEKTPSSEKIKKYQNEIVKNKDKSL